MKYYYKADVELEENYGTIGVLYLRSRIPVLRRFIKSGSRLALCAYQANVQYRCEDKEGTAIFKDAVFTAA